MNSGEWVILSDSPSRTREIGRRIGALLTHGTCVALVGQLGAGKTEMVKGITSGAGVADDVVVNSPTYVIVNEYPGRLYIHHIDAYRLGGAEELEAVGIDEMLSGEGAVLIEWADRVSDLLPSDCLHISIEHAGGDERRIRVRGPRRFAPIRG